MNHVVEMDDATMDGLRKLLYDIEAGETLDERDLEEAEVVGLGWLLQDLVLRQ